LTRLRGITIAAFIVASLAMAALGIAGLSKGLDVAFFRTELRGWSFIPKLVAPFIAVLLPALELALALFWFLNVRRRVVAVAALLLTAAATTAFAIHWAVDDPSTCGCLGPLGKRLVVLESVKLVLPRNVLLMVAFGVFLWTSRHPSADQSSPGQSAVPVSV